MTDEFDDAERRSSEPPDGIRTGEWLMGQTFPDLYWHVENLIPEGFTLNVGGPKLGKSWLMHNIALASASGGTVLSERLDRPPRVAPGPRGLEPAVEVPHHQARLRHQPPPGEWSYLTASRPVDGPARSSPTGSTGSKPIEPPPLVIIDTLGRVKRQPATRRIPIRPRLPHRR